MKKLYYLLLVLAGATQFAHAQSAGQYYFKYKTGVALEDMSGATALIGKDNDGALSASTAFFQFAFAGNSYDHFSVSEDGLVVLGNAVYTPYTYDNYFTQKPNTVGQAAAYPIFLLWGDDLHTVSNGGVKYKVNGSGTSKKLVIEFQVKQTQNINASYLYSPSTYFESYDKTFQLWLFEGTNTIQYVYGSCTKSNFGLGNIGVAASATDYLSVNSSTNTASATNIDNNTGNIPGTGTSYVFSPTPIVEANPIVASVTMTPEYPVPGQHHYTIYLGYGPQSVSLNAKATGGNPSATGYTYSWSPATGLSNASSAAPTASPLTTTTYTVNITDGNGNSAKKSFTVYTLDPRLGDKFVVCKNGVRTICVSKEAVDAQLSSGAGLGDCAVANVDPSVAATTIGRSNQMVGEASASAAGTVYPSPSNGTFNVRLPENAQQATVVVFDASGRPVAQKVAGENQQVVTFNLFNHAPGVYLIKVTSGSNVQMSKVIVK